ncbi:hypothetical protein HHK36_019664 [Tetracentron sinense]|uniref:dihydropyrimidinase n=1 Tax=Tetracentron sinense TaxID=13715 RepID=A0A834YU76_TETSI|nr:hypothetical protein HHK36_019664 [Tetracentron sinense]
MAELRFSLSWRRIRFMDSKIRTQRTDLLSILLLLLILSPISESNQFCSAGYGDLECGSSSSSKLLIKGGIVVNAHHQEIADVYIEDGIIVAVQPHIKVNSFKICTISDALASAMASKVGDDVTVLDASGNKERTLSQGLKENADENHVGLCGKKIHANLGLWMVGQPVASSQRPHLEELNPNKINLGVELTVMKGNAFEIVGGIDPHTHLSMEFMGTETIDDFFSGQAAALAGGTTMHIDFAIPVNGSLSAGFEAYTDKAKKSCMDYGFHMAITKWDEIVSREMEIMVKEKGINSFKFFLAYKGALMINDELLLQGFRKCKSLGALAMVHAENGDAVVEGQKRMIDLGITGPEGHALSRPPLVVLLFLLRDTTHH